MADDQFHLGSGNNWWDSSRNSETMPVSISTTLNAIASFGWPPDMAEADMKSRPSAATAAAAGGGSGGGGGGLANPGLQMMGLGLSSRSMEWNQALFRGEKAESSFRSLLQEDYQQESGGAAAAAPPQQENWRTKAYSGASSDDSSVNDTSPITSHNLSGGGFQVDSAAAYGLLLSDSAYQNRPMNYNPYPPSGCYGGNAAGLIPSWNKYPEFLRTSPPKQQQPPPPPPPQAGGGNHLHFVNSTPFWNPSTAMTDARPSFAPASLQTQLPAAPSFDEKPKNTSETTKKSTTETSSNKRPRNETPSPSPAFKVRKEKMGDRITALQQLVSPFGKTDTASVLSEAIEYIKFLHEQVRALATPYMKNGAPTQQHQKSDHKSNDQEGARQDLRSRGLCLVPVSSTFPVTHETAVDFWTPTFGVTFR